MSCWLWSVPTGRSVQCSCNELEITTFSSFFPLEIPQPSLMPHLKLPFSDPIKHHISLFFYSILCSHPRKKQKKEKVACEVSYSLSAILEQGVRQACYSLQQNHMCSQVNSLLRLFFCPCRWSYMHTHNRIYIPDIYIFCMKRHITFFISILDIKSN